MDSPTNPPVPETPTAVAPSLDESLGRVRRAATTERRLRARAERLSKLYLAAFAALKTATAETAAARSALDELLEKK